MAAAVAPPPPLPMGPPAPQAAWPNGPAPRPRRFSQAAVTSFVVGLGALVVALFLPAFVTGAAGAGAVVSALVAFGEVSGGRRRGLGLAVAGLVLGILGVLLAIGVFLVGGIVDKTPPTAPDGSPVATMASCEIETRTIKTATEAWVAHGGHGTPWPAQASDLVDAGYLAKVPALHTIEGDGASPPEILLLNGQCRGEAIEQLDG